MKASKPSYRTQGEYLAASTYRIINSEPGHVSSFNTPTPSPLHLYRVNMATTARNTVERLDRPSAYFQNKVGFPIVETTPTREPEDRDTTPLRSEWILTLLDFLHATEQAKADGFHGRNRASTASRRSPCQRNHPLRG